MKYFMTIIFISVFQLLNSQTISETEDWIVKTIMKSGGTPGNEGSFYKAKIDTGYLSISYYSNTGFVESPELFFYNIEIPIEHIDSVGTVIINETYGNYSEKEITFYMKPGYNIRVITARKGHIIFADSRSIILETDNNTHEKFIRYLHKLMNFYNQGQDE